MDYTKEIESLKSKLTITQAKADEALILRKVTAFYNHIRECDDIKKQIERLEYLNSIDPNQLSMF